VWLSLLSSSCLANPLMAGIVCGVCRLLVAAAVALPDELVTGLLVLSLLPASFSVEMAAPLLALPVTNNERHSGEVLQGP